MGRKICRIAVRTLPLVIGLALILSGAMPQVLAQGGNGCFTKIHDTGTVVNGQIQWQGFFATCSTGCETDATCTRISMGTTLYMNVVVDAQTCVCVVELEGEDLRYFAPEEVWDPWAPPFHMYCDQAVYVDLNTGAYAGFPGCIDTNNCGGTGEECEPGTEIIIHDSFAPGMHERQTLGCDCQ
jgi:hypothetical protein